MVELYGHRWISVHGEGATDGSAETWAKGLAGLAPEQIATGVEACIAAGASWPPTLPEFRAMCLGIPSFGAIDAEILTLKDAQRSDFARLVWSFIDGYQHRHVRAEEAKRMRRDAYEQACDHVMRGGALPPRPAAAVEHQAPPKPKSGRSPRTVTPRTFV